MIRIDGSKGEGGGQILRSALTLSMCLGKPIEVYNIRAKRSKPGLLRQHLRCVKASQEISNAKVSGAELGSLQITFQPEKIRGGKFQFAIGSAGSTVLVAQTILPALLMANESSEITLQGGTHNGMAPSVDFFRYSYLPLLSQLSGATLDVELTSHGFYPAGGGEWRLKVQGGKGFSEIDLISQGEVLSQHAYAISSRLPESINERQLQHVQNKCSWSDATMQSLMVNSPGSGNIVSLRVTTQSACAIFESVGERGISAEKVVDKALKAMRRYLSSGAAVEEHLSDQLIIPMVLAGSGCFTSTNPSSHLRTNIAVVEAITGTRIAVNEITKDCWEIKLE